MQILQIRLASHDQQFPHHMQILKDAGVVKSRKEGKFVYYYFDATCKNIDALLRLFEDVKRVIQSGKV